jgi:uncharacterized membrane protein
MARAMAIALTAGALLWVVAIVGAAMMRGGTSATVYKFGSVVCHQRPERSVALNGRPLPVCARCAALYVAGALAALAAWIGSGRALTRSREVLLLAAIPTALTIPIEWFGVSPLSNAIRAAAALPLGAAAGWVFVRALRSEADAL